MELKHKNLKSKEFKLLDEAQGTFRAVFATLNVIDHDGDIIMPGAIENGTKVIISPYNHSSVWRDELPAGKGIIREENNELVVEGQYFLDTINGSETYKTIKNMEDLQEWSFGYDTLEEDLTAINGQRANLLKKLKVFEVSPVIMGAGIDTRTTDVKQLKKAIPSHSTETVDQKWDAAANLKRLKDDQKASYYKKMFAWVDPEGDPEKKSSYKFPHHEVDADGNIGAANVRGCIAGIAALNGARGGSSIPEADRKGVWNHLAKHLKDADMEPAELKALDAEPKGMKFADHSEFVAEAIKDLVARSRAIEELREAEGKMISEKSIDRLKAVKGEIAEAITCLDKIIKSKESALKLYADYLAIQNKILTRS